MRNVTDVASSPNISGFYPVLAPLDLQGLQKRAKELGAVFSWDRDHQFASFTMAHLMRKPICMKILQEELTREISPNHVLKESDLSKLNYLQACLKEAIGRNPSYWEDPLELKPERFLNSSLDFKGNVFEYIPFGSGRRICPGMTMAAKQIPLIVASLVHSFDWSLPQGKSR
ncbi:hypothetical protein TIFTF001_003629 [Ficus carica]|uniref:Cytochrome P450 n=1 Tax=Ficus carica TaxID=3494 RepID=A0AA88CWA9_FICCA|nr:hypothetical protein TIFTF001_003628 [Ficus carica]GMN32324.1 hypothetical protein TIFTF001_003629 [Ficus carica]